MAQTKTIQLLRSSALYTPTAAGEGVSAKTALENAKAALIALSGRKDGEIVLARYQETGGEIKSLLGIYHTSPDLGNGQGTGGADVSYTGGWTFLQDITSSSEGLTQLQAEIDRIESNVGLGDDGTYTSGYSSDEIVETPTTLKATVDAIVSFIKTLNKAADAQNGQVVTTVTQTNGAVTETKANVKDLQLGGYSKDANATGAIGSTDTVNAALSKLENTIAKNTVSSNDKTITINTTGATTDLSVNVDGTTVVKNSSTGVISSALKVIKVIPTGTAGTDEVVDSTLGTNVKEAYRLVYDGSNTAIGKQINVYKDSALSRVYLGHVDDTINPSTGAAATTGTGDTALCFVYHKEDGTYELVPVNVQSFLQESEFADGLQVTNHVVSVKIDSSSEKDSQDTPVDFLSVGSNGIKVSGIKDEINRKIAALDVTDTAVAGQYVSAVNETDGKVSMTRANVSEAVLNNYANGTAPASLDIAATDTINQAFAKLEHKIADGIDALDGAATATAPAANGDFSVLTKVNEINGVVQSVGTGNDNSKEVLLKKVAATGAAEDVTIADSGNLITATNVESALQEIATNVKDNAIVSNDVIVATKDTTNHNTKLSVTIGNGLEKTGTNGNTLAVKQGDGVTVNANGVSVNAGDGLVIDNSGNVNVNTGDGLEIASDAVKIKLDTTTSTANITSDMLSISANGLMMKDTWDCGVF